VIDQAAKRLVCTRLEFILEAAYHKAEEELLGQVFFAVDAQAFEQFQAILDNPPAPTVELRRLLLTKVPWEGHRCFLIAFAERFGPIALRLHRRICR
jgi:uncharacterized protein (DUF1778 family)